MHDFELDQLRRNPTWAATLRYYWELQTQGRAESADFDGWVPRVMSVPEVAQEKLSSVHGRLIAFGFLKFDLSNRDIGMRYQLTSLAKQALGHEEALPEAAELAESA